MAKYIATGADKETGDPRREIIFASDESEARAVASHRGIMVESMRDVAAHHAVMAEGKRLAEEAGDGNSHSETDYGFWGCSVGACLIVFLSVFGCLRCAISCSDADISRRRAAGQYDREPAEKDRSRTAVLMSEKFVKDQLKSPSTAEFPSIHSVTVTREGDDVYVITSHVDSQNGFGAMLRSNYVAKLRFRGENRWAAISVIVLPQ